MSGRGLINGWEGLVWWLLLLVFLYRQNVTNIGHRLVVLVLMISLLQWLINRY